MSMAAVAIGTTVVAVAGAATAAGMQASAADKAAKAQGAAGKKAAKAERAAMEARERAIKKLGKGQKLLEKDLKAIQAPVMDIGADIREAERITGYNLSQLERIYPGAANQRQLASLAINDMIQGKLPQSVIGETMREAAQRGGAGFNIATAGKGAIAQAPQYDYARAIGASSYGVMQQGLDQSAKWQAVAGQFIQNVPQISGLRYQYGMGAANVGLQKIDTRRQMLSDLYGAQIGGAEAQQQMGQRQYTRSQEGISANLAARQATAQGIGDVTGTVGQLGISGYMAYNQLDAAKGAEMASGALSNKGGYAGGFDYSKAYGPATYGGAKPGFGNFDYGSGTGA